MSAKDIMRGGIIEYFYTKGMKEGIKFRITEETKAIETRTESKPAEPKPSKPKPEPVVATKSHSIGFSNSLPGASHTLSEPTGETYKSRRVAGIGKSYVATHESFLNSTKELSLEEYSSLKKEAEVRGLKEVTVDRKKADWSAVVDPEKEVKSTAHIDVITERLVKGNITSLELPNSEILKIKFEDAKKVDIDATIGLMKSDPNCAENVTAILKLKTFKINGIDFRGVIEQKFPHLAEQQKPLSSNLGRATIVG